MIINAKDRNRLQTEHAALQADIRARLDAFRAIPAGRYFYELCYCLLTPQSSAAHCDVVVNELERRDFFHAQIDPEPLLRGFEGAYIRFHRTKARRLTALKLTFPVIAPLFNETVATQALREKLVQTIDGIGYKEASHFLRNIGRLDVAIIDRHILRNLARFGYMGETPKSITRGRYLQLEQLFLLFAREAGIAPDELDLLLWHHETGFILK
jgi:N-glycosylase/DNA lyase